MSEYILIGLIAISLVAALVFFLIIRKPGQTRAERYGQHIFVSNGVDLKTMRYGRQKGDHFYTGQLEDGTVLVKGNSMPVCTIFLTNIMTGREYKKSFRTEVYLGREMTGGLHENKIVIEGDSKISRTHCRIRYLNHQLLIDDLQTPNHTYLNGMQVQGTTIINQNDELRIGETRLNIRYKGRH